MYKFIIGIFATLSVTACVGDDPSISVPERESDGDSKQQNDAAANNSNITPDGSTEPNGSNPDGSTANDAGAGTDGNVSHDGSAGNCVGEGSVRCWNNERQVCIGSLWTFEQSTNVPCNSECTAPLGTYKVVVSGSYNNVVERSGTSYERRLRLEDTYANAKSACAAIGWRLPNIGEVSNLLGDITNASCNPRVDQSALIVLPDEEIWYANTASSSYSISLVNGTTTQRTSTDKFKYICVKL